MFYIRIVICLLISVSLTNCIDEIDFEVGEPDSVLVVDGSISNYSEKHRIRLTRSGDLKDKVFTPEKEASITLFDENGVIDNYVELEDGWYELGSEFAGDYGCSYYIEILTRLGKLYRSQPETIQPHLELTGDDLSFEAIWEEFVALNGNIQNKPFVKVFVDFTIPEAEDGPYLRWTVDNIFLIQDRACGGLDVSEVCYVRPPRDGQDVNLFSGEGVSAGSNFKQEVSKEIINYAFGLRHSFTVNQFIHTREAFEYWAKIDLIANQSGSIFDSPPAPIQGNVFNVNDSNEQVLGYFAGVARDTAHQFIVVTDVLDVAPATRAICTFGNVPPPFPNVCCDCLAHDYASKDRPDFW